MNPMSAIVLVVDRLGAAYLGPYGNTWLETAGFNRLASESLLCEHMLAVAPDLATTYRHYWFGEPASEKSLPAIARAAGCRAILLTDDESIAAMPGSSDFDEIQLIKSVENLTSPVEDVADTVFIKLMEAAAELLAAWRETSQPQLLWIHARGMNGAWDAPQELREQFADEEDPTPSTTTIPPNEMLADDHDPDQVLSLTHAYAGQVSIIDLGLQALIAAIDDLPQRDSLLFAVTSPRGFPLGEHLRLGECDQALYGELLHVPCLIRFPQHEGALMRTQELLQPRDLFATLTDHGACQRSLLRIVRGELSASREFAIAAGPNQRLIRTAAWQLRAVRDEDEEIYELYVKPDDCHEFNDVASRAPQIVEQLVGLLDQPTAGDLPEELVSMWR
jgi:arylsulfatase A-like enzyme